MTDEVKFTDAQWDELARAAEAFATVLEEQYRLLENVVAKNWAGDCAEGLGTFDNLRQLVHGSNQSSFGGAIDAEAVYLRMFAERCATAKVALANVDIDTAGDLKYAP